MEIFKEIEGYEGLYEVSNLGRVKSLKKVCVHKFGSMIRKEMILNKQIDKDGYETIFLRKDNQCKNMKVHRLVAQAFLNNDYNKKCVNHLDSNRSNNIFTNLEWVTVKENTNHAFKYGYRNMDALRNCNYFKKNKK